MLPVADNHCFSTCPDGAKKPRLEAFTNGNDACQFTAPAGCSENRTTCEVGESDVSGHGTLGIADLRTTVDGERESAQCVETWLLEPVLEPALLRTIPELTKFYALEITQRRLVSIVMKLLFDILPLASPEWDHVKRVKRIVVDYHPKKCSSGAVSCESDSSTHSFDSKAEISSNISNIVNYASDSRLPLHRATPSEPGLNNELNCLNVVADTGSSAPLTSSLVQVTKFHILLCEVDKFEERSAMLDMLKSGFQTISHSFPKDLQNYNFGDDVIELDIPRHRPRSIAQFSSYSLFWPLNFHKNEQLELILSGANFFSWSERSTISNFMRRAFENGQIAHQHGQIPVGCLIVDSSSQQVVASTFDQRVGLVHSPSKLSLITPSQNLCLSASMLGGVSLPWRANGCAPIPQTFTDLYHAVMCAIDLAARFQGAGAWRNVMDVRQLFTTHKETKGVSEPATPLQRGPAYICAGFDCYVTHEPCAMCTMALLHSRIRRVYYAIPRASTGALGSLRMLHADRRLNHRFDVWKVHYKQVDDFLNITLPEDCEV